MMRCAVTVAYGPPAEQAAKRARSSFLRHHDLPIFTITDNHNLPHALSYAEPGPGARRAKLNLLNLLPSGFDSILYLDADTEVLGNLTPGYEIIERGYDIAIAPSVNQGFNVFSHIDNADRDYTLEYLLNPFPLQLQAGVMFIRRNAETTELFNLWLNEWAEYHNQDQAALLRALDKYQLRIWLLSNDWNGGSLVAHHFGEAR